MNILNATRSDHARAILLVKQTKKNNRATSIAFTACALIIFFIIVKALTNLI